MRICSLGAYLYHFCAMLHTEARVLFTLLHVGTGAALTIPASMGADALLHGATVNSLQQVSMAAITLGFVALASNPTFPPELPSKQGLT